MGIFDFYAFVKELRREVKEGSTEMSRPSLLDSITEDTDFTDLPFYKEYLSKFDIKESFKDVGIVGLKVPEELKDDFDYNLLIQLVVSSFSSEYEFEFDAETHMVDLWITTKSGNQSVTKSIQELWAFQIIRLYEIYIKEQLNLEGIRFDSEKDREDVDKYREVKLSEFLKIMKRIKMRSMNLEQNQQEIDDAEDEIDELMNS